MTGSCTNVVAQLGFDSKLEPVTCPALERQQERVTWGRSLCASRHRGCILLRELLTASVARTLAHPFLTTAPSVE